MQPQEQQNQNQQPTHEQDNRPFNPLMDAVNVKPYTKINVDASPEALMQPIPEASFESNTISSNERAYDMVSDEGVKQNGGGAMPAGGGGSYTSMNSMKNEDAEMGAKQLAKVIIDSYEGLHALANKGLQFNERKLMKLQKEGLIDLSIPVPYDMSGSTIAAGDFIQQLNKNNEDTLTVSPQFKKEVTPVLTRVLQKRGAGMTDEQMLIYLFGKDIAVKGVLFFQVKSTMNEYLEQLKELTEAYRGNGGGASPQPQPSPQPAAAQPQQAPVVVMNPESEDFNFKSNETFQQTVVPVQKMAVPETGKERAIKQKAKNERLAKAAATAQAANVTTPVVITPEIKAEGQKTYQEILAQRKTGKRGVKNAKKVDPKDYIESVDESKVAEMLQLKPTDQSNTEEPQTN